MLRRALALLAFVPIIASAQSPSVDDLIATDRAFSVASEKTDLISGLTAMFAADVTMPLPSRTWAQGVEKVTDALRAVSGNTESRADWTPLGAGISADGLHGYTFGFMTVHRPDGSAMPLKYMSYWVKGREGWRVVAYKRGRRAEGEVPATMLPAVLPARHVAPASEPTLLAAFRESLAQAEQSFSDEAQRIGLGPAFARWGAPDAVNMGPGSSYTIGAAQIAKLMGDPPSPPASPVSWKSDRVIVAPSGDLGISIGMIRSNADPNAPPSPFFTIWRRASPGDPWRYVAE